MSTFRTNAVSYAHLINAFMPLVLLGDVKKVILISTGMADTELIRKHNVWMGFAYAVSKAALNMIVAKASADYQEKGVLILAISPGFVATSDMSGGRLTSSFPPYRGLSALIALSTRFRFTLRGGYGFQIHRVRTEFQGSPDPRGVSQAYSFCD